MAQLRDPRRFFLLNYKEEIPQVLSFPWEPKGKVFYSNGKPLTHKGFTAFPLLNHFEKGKDIRPWLNQFKGYNAARIFPYVPVKDWKETAWDFPTNQATLEFCNFMKDQGFVVKLCLITDDDEGRIHQIKELVNFLKASKPTNLILEGANEAHYFKTDVNVIKNLLTGSGFPYASGIYDDNTKHFGNYWVDHSERDREWFRKGGHNCYEAFNGGGPNHKLEPALRQPCIEDEPIRPDQNGNDYLGYYAYSASCVLLGAGATFHCSSGKFCSPLNEGEVKCKDFFLQGLNAFPPIETLVYDRIVEPGNEVGGPTVYARTFTNGNYAVRIKQEGKEFPLPGWKALDEYGICWSK